MNTGALLFLNAVDRPKRMHSRKREAESAGNWPKVEAACLPDGPGVLAFGRPPRGCGGQGDFELPPELGGRIDPVLDEIEWPLARRIEYAANIKPHHAKADRNDAAGEELRGHGERPERRRLVDKKENGESRRGEKAKACKGEPGIDDEI